jgi:hypothetical protein
MTLGNFSDDLQRRDISKMSIGFIPDISFISKELILKHLLEKTGYSKTAAKEAIKTHKRLIEREYWDLCFSSIKKYAETGVHMYILGKGLCNVFPVLAYCVGDDPALHRYCGVYEGNALHSCIYCNYSVKDDGIYNPNQQRPRQPDMIRQACSLARSGELKKAARQRLLQIEINAMEVLKARGLHNIPNATWGVPMGYVAPGVLNHVFRSPCDILHTFECGICKNVCLWTISLVLLISKVPRYKFSAGMLDGRIACFKDLPKLPNVTQTYFLKGICFISSNKSAADKTKSTGGAGGFRSCEFVPLLIQLYFAIGVNGDIFPTTPTFRISNEIQVGNMSKIILTCISKVLDCFFSTRISPLTAQRVDIIQNKMMDMSQYYIALYQLLDTSSGREVPRLPLSRKIHAACCNIKPFLEVFGTLDKADTASYESVHRYMTVGLWHCTSKRYDSMNEEMAKQSLLSNYHLINSFKHALTSETMEKYIIKNGPYIAPPTVEISSGNNTASDFLHINEENIIECESELLNHLILCVRVNIQTLSIALKNTFGDEVWDLIKFGERPPSLTVLQSISIEGNKNSRLGKVMIYATNKFRNKRPRHDFVIVQHEDWDQPAQVLLLFQMNSFDNEHSQLFAYVRYLLPVDRRQETPAIYQCPFPRYQLEFGPRRRGYSEAVIDVETIMGPAFITPTFQKGNSLPSPNNPQRRDLWWYIDRKFCDRAGWDNIQPLEEQPQVLNNDHQIEIHVPNIADINVDDADAFIDSNSEDDYFDGGDDDENDEDDDQNL